MGVSSYLFVIAVNKLLYEMSDILLTVINVIENDYAFLFFRDIV